jgi:hypothetical protein
VFQTPPPDQPADNVPAPAVKPRARNRWHVSVRSLVLLTASIAVWLTYAINRRHNAMLEARISAMVPVAHELRIDDPKAIAVVALDEWFFDASRWDLYLPDGPYRLCLATRGITFERFAPVVKSAPLKAGRHHIALDERRNGEAWRITVAWDGTGLMAVDEPGDWHDPSGGWTSSSDATPSCRQRPADDPVILLRTRFYRPDSAAETGPSEPRDGILLWIEKVGTPHGAP